ncbi:MAG: TerB family tellurite resistance protein [Devosia sp.]
MFDALNRLFARPEPRLFANDPKLAVAALLIHLAGVDGSVKAEERDAVRGVLMDQYGMDEGEVEQLVAEATRQDSEAVDFYRFTSALKELSDEEKIGIVRMMWQVVFADKKNHELEDNMVWRVAELLNVPARQRNILRNQMARS